MEHIQIWHHIFLTKKSSISMTLKIKISQFYDVSEPKQWKWNKIILFSIGNVQIWHHFSLVTKYEYISMTFDNGIFQFHCKSEQKQIKWNDTKQDISKSDSIFPYLQRRMLFKWLLKFISWQGLSQKWMIAVPKEKSTSFNFLP